MRYGLGFANAPSGPSTARHRSPGQLTEPIHRVLGKEVAPRLPDRAYVG